MQRKGTNMDYVLEINNMSFVKNRGLLRKKKLKLEDITMALPYGYLCGIAGENGAGKSTLLEAILDNDARYCGEIRVCGEDLRMNQARLNQKIAYIREERMFFNEKSAVENARILSVLYEEFHMDIFEQTLAKMEVAKTKKLCSMSRGEFMRFQLAFSMAQKPALYLMDEVTAGMDPVFKRDFFRMLHEVIADESASVVMITHIEEELTKQMDYVGVMKEGHLISFRENDAL